MYPIACLPSRAMGVEDWVMRFYPASDSKDTAIHNPRQSQTAEKYDGGRIFQSN
jgi:hypothetical protein